MLDYHSKEGHMRRSVKSVKARNAPKHAIPSLAGWDRFPGGANAAPGKYSYSISPFRPRTAVFSIDPASSVKNRHIGYRLWASDIPDGVKWVWIGADGRGCTRATSLYTSPQAAVTAARLYYDHVMGGEKINRENPLRSIFADPGGKSALRAASPRNPRNMPCPTCHQPNKLTPADVRAGYQCNECADRDEGGGY